MNTFADSLFSMLFGWVRTLVQGVWSAVVQGHSGGFFSWLGDHWLWLALIICLICTAVDFIIWMIRWRPYLVWRTKFRRLLRRLRGEPEDARAFETGYTDGVALNLQDEPAPEWQPAPDLPPETPARQPAVLPEEFYVPRQPLPQEASAPQVPQPADAYAAPVSYEAPAYSTPAGEYIPLPEQPPADPVAAPRRRRSDKHAQKKVSWHERLVADDDDQEGLLDGLPPAVDREQAFHEPVYPQGSAHYSAWKKPDNNNQMNG